MLRYKLNKIAFWTIILFSIAGIQIALFPGPTTRNIIELICYVLIGAIFISHSNIIFNPNLPYKKLVIAFFIYGIFILIRSATIAQSYEQWRYLVTLGMFFILFPWLIFIGSFPIFTFSILKTMLSYSLPLSFVFFVLDRMNWSENVHYVKYTSIIYFLILFLPYLKSKWKVIIIVISITSLLSNLENRTNIISIFTSYFMMFFGYLLLKESISKIIRFVLVFLPILLFLLGISGIFNVFGFIDKKDNYIISTTTTEVNMTSDSRTAIYKDAINNIIEKKNWLIGNGVTDIYKTNLALDLTGYEKGRMGASEAGFLNILSFGGIIFTVIIFLLFYLSSYLAIYKSKNSIVKQLGLYIALQWFLIFIEKPLELNFYWASMFIIIGICLSPEFRNCSNNQIEKFLKTL